MGKGKEKRSKKEKGQISKQLEEKWIGSRSEVFSRIIAKETEIRAKTSDERRKADRMIEDAKGKAAAIKRKAVMEEIGKSYYERELESARQQVEEIERSAEAEARKIKEESSAKIEEAVKFIIEAVTSSATTNN
jgi:hypothetical protein